MSSTCTLYLSDRNTRQNGQLGPFHTRPEKFEKAALCVRWGLPSTQIRHENRTFRKRISNRRNLKAPILRFRVDGRLLDNGAFRNRWPRWRTRPKTPTAWIQKLHLSCGNGYSEIHDDFFRSKSGRNRLSVHKQNMFQSSEKLPGTFVCFSAPRSKSEVHRWRKIFENFWRM